MNKLFLILMSDAIDREKLIEFLTNSAKINFWFFNFPYSVFVETNLTSLELKNLIQKGFGNNSLLFITQIKDKTTYAGVVPTEHVKYFDKF